MLLPTPRREKMTIHFSASIICLFQRVTGYTFACQSNGALNKQKCNLLINHFQELICCCFLNYFCLLLYIRHGESVSQKGNNAQRLLHSSEKSQYTCYNYLHLQTCTSLHENLIFVHRTAQPVENLYWYAGSKGVVFSKPLMTDGKATVRCY